MSIPAPFNPLGTLGASPLPPGFRQLAYVETTKSGPWPFELPWPGLVAAAFNQETDTLIIDGGSTGGGTIFAHDSSNSKFIGAKASISRGVVLASNGTISPFAFEKAFEQGHLYHFVIAPDRLSIDDSVKIKNFEPMTGVNAYAWGTGVLIARVEHVGADGDSVETVVAAERIADGALGLVSLTTGVFLEV